MTIGRFVTVVICWFAGGLMPAWSQTGPGTLRGQVTDPAGARIPGAVVVATDGHGTSRSATADPRGEYILANLPAATYMVRVSAKGFGTAEQPDVALVSGATQILNFPLALASERQSVTVSDSGQSLNVEVDPSANAGALVMRGSDLDALSDDRDDLAGDLAALAGPSAGPNGGQIFIDGFTGGRMPSKQSIREVRINQNPFGAQFDKPGQGRIEIFTKPGTEDFHGQATFQFGDGMFNSRNPFAAVKPNYQKRQYEGELSGPLGKRTSFFFDFEVRKLDDNAVISAVILDSTNNIVPFSQAIVTPASSSEAHFKLDRQLSTNHNLTFAYTLGTDANDNQGIGGQTLASRAFQGRNRDDSFQVRETGVLSPKTINEARFRYRRLRVRQQGDVSQPGITVLDAFSGGGPGLSLSFNNQDRFEVQNMTSHSLGTHFVRWGGLMRGGLLKDQSTQNYAGTFTFTSLDSYRVTLMGVSAGRTPDQIRASGGGASQFTRAGGNPLASLNQFDYAVFVADDWRLHPRFLLSFGLRYEFQTNSGDYRDIAPRLGFSWGLGASKTKTPKTVIRGGFGIFYDRIGENLTLDAFRQDGVRQQQFLIPNPDFFPIVPSVQTLTAGLQPQSIRETYAGWRAPVLIQAAIGVDRQLTKTVTVSSNVIHSSGAHALRSRNINAPIPGSGVLPYGTPNSIYLYETTGVYRQNQWITNVNARLNARLNFSGFYAYGHANSNTDGPATFPVNQYDLSGEFGRAGFDTRHRFQFNGTATLPWALRINPFLTMTSGRPYNITVGKDLNGDGLFNDRPALATDLSRTSVIRTELGAVDLLPMTGAKLVARNYATGPGVISANLRLTKTFTLREHSSKSKKTSDPKQIIVWVMARNVLNHPNLTQPSGNLSSPIFGQSSSLLAGQGVNGTRRIEAQIRFSF